MECLGSRVSGLKGLWLSENSCVPWSWCVGGNKCVSASEITFFHVNSRGLCFKVVFGAFFSSREFT